MSNTNKNPLANLTFSGILLFLRRRLFLSVALFSWITMIILTLLVVVPQFNLIIANTENLAVEEKKLVELQSRTAFLQALDRQTLLDQQAMFQLVLPSQKPVVPLISSIEKLATDANVSLEKYQLSPGSIATESGQVSLQATAKALVEGVGSLPLKLEVQGGFAAMNTFFKTLDQIVPLVNVKSIEFAEVSQTKDLPPEAIQYKASVDLDSLYALPEAVKPVANPALAAFTLAERNLLATLSGMIANQPKAPLESLTSPTATEGGVLRPSIFSF